MKTLIIMIAFVSFSNVQAVDHTFTYQGELMDNNNAANGSYDIVIQAFDAESSGNTVGSESTHIGIIATNGIFTINDVDLGIGLYNGLDIWLQISVKKTVDANYTALSPLQKMRSVPYATTLIDKGATDGQVLEFDDVNGWQPANVNNNTDNQNIENLGLVGTTLTVGIEDGSSQNIDMSSLQDGIGTDDQNIESLSLNGTDLTVGIENGNSQNVDLASLQDGTGTDSQDLNLIGKALFISNGSSAIFQGWDDNVTDDFSGNYNDLTNKPSFTDWDTNVNDDFSGDYNDLSNQPWAFDGLNASRVSGFTGFGLTNPAANLHIKMSSASNVSGGLRLESASSSGEDWYIRMPVSDDLVIRNDGTDLLTIKKDTGNVEMEGELQASVSGDADMKAYIYGKIDVDIPNVITGGPISTSVQSNYSSDGFTVTRDDIGVYNIIFDTEPLSAYIVVTTVIRTPSEFGFYNAKVVNYSLTALDNIKVRIYGLDGSRADSSFSFVVYKK